MADLPQQKSPRQIIKSFEAKAMRKRAFPDRIADFLTSYFGSISFFSANAVFFLAWIVLNLGYLRPAIEPFDPFPFVLLTMVVSLEAIFLSVIVLMSQNRQGYISTLRDELQLQVNLITERELTKALQLISDLHVHHGVKRGEDPELEAMLKATNISYIERKLTEQIQSPSPPSLAQVVTAPIVRITQAVVGKTTQANGGNGKKAEENAVRVGSAKASG